MSETTVSVLGQIVHTEVVSNDVEGDKEFFAKVFGWEYDVMPMPAPAEGDYVMWKAGDKPGGGITPPMDPNQPPSTLNYLAVEDCDATVAAIEAAGGKVLAPAFNVGDFGRMAVFQVPGGAVLACWQELANA